MLKITSNDDVCGPVEYPCSTNHVEINDVYVCIHNGWEELRKSALSELSLTNKNKHEYYGHSQPHNLTASQPYSLSHNDSSKSLWECYLFQYPSQPMRRGEITLT